MKIYTFMDTYTYNRVRGAPMEQIVSSDKVIAVIAEDIIIALAKVPLVERGEWTLIGVEPL